MTPDLIDRALEALAECKERVEREDAGDFCEPESWIGMAEELASALEELLRGQATRDADDTLLERLDRLGSEPEDEVV